MDDLEFVRGLAPDTPEPSKQVRTRAHEALLAHIEAGRTTASDRKPSIVYRTFRSPWRLATVGAAVVLVAATLVLTSQLGGEKTASAAGTLREMAGVAATQTEPTPLAAGHYVYVQSTEAYLQHFSAEEGFAILVPQTREVWLGEQSRLRTTSAGEPQFLSERDRERWIAAGRPAPDTTTDTSLGAVSAPDLPTDPDALFDRLKQEAADAGHGLFLEMFVLVGDNLRGTLASTALRASLYEVAARIPGVTLEGEMLDSAGRPGIGVSMVDSVDHTKRALVIDPKTSQLLEEQEVVLDDGYELGYPAGTVIGHATYLTSATVPNNSDRPDAAN
jgi:hypothetical protein